MSEAEDNTRPREREEAPPEAEVAVTEDLLHAVEAEVAAASAPEGDRITGAAALVDGATDPQPTTAKAASPDPSALLQLIAPLHIADLADLITQLDDVTRARFIALTADHLDFDLLGYLGEDVRDAVVAELGPERIAKAITDLDSDDAVYVLEDLDRAAQAEVLASLSRADRALLEQGLAYPEDSAGRLMQRELVAVAPFWTVGQTIDFMRAAQDLPADFYDIFVVDPGFRPVGLVPLSRLLRTRRPVRVAEIMVKNPRTVPVTMDQEEVAYLFRQYGLVEVAVVDASQRLVGTITHDDVVEVIDEEAEEDILALAGVSDGAVTSGVFTMVRSRIGWLAINLITAIFASAVIALFEDIIAQVVALAVLMPIVASMGGNAGTQTLTIAVRALAMKEIRGSAGWRLIGKEAMVGIINGLAFAILCGGLAWLWLREPLIGVTIAVAMVANLLIAGIAGAGIPLGLRRIGVDPAIASAVFLTTITDVVGFFAFLGLAALLLI